MAEIQLPGKWSLASFSGYPKFDGTEDGNTEINLYNTALANYQKQLKISKISKWVCFILGICLSFKTDGSSLGMLGLLLILIGAIVFTRKGFYGRKVQKAYDQAWSRYCTYFEKLAHYCADKLISNYRWAKFGNKYMFYNNNCLVHIDTNQDLIVAYNKSNIKEVTRDRVHVGSHTSGNTTGVGVGTTTPKMVDSFFSLNKHLRMDSVGVSQSHTSADTTDFYEWHFDVLTDFLDYPKVSFVLNDNRDNENIINNMYAILRP